MHYKPSREMKKKLLGFYIEEDDTELDLDFEVPIINTDKYYQEFFGVPEYIRYPFWFDISHIEYDDLVVSYKIMGAQQLHHEMQKITEQQTQLG